MSLPIEPRTRLAGLSDDDLGAQLSLLGAQTVWPAAEGVASSVIARIAATQPRSAAADRGRALDRFRAARSLRRAAVLAMAALLLVATIAVGLGLGVPGIRIFFGPAPSATPSPAPVASPTTSSSASPPPLPTAIGASPSPSPSAPGLGDGLFLGRRASLAEARATADFPVLVPTLPGVGPPAEVWIDGSGPAVVVSFVWPAGVAGPAVPDSSVGMLLTEFRGNVNPDFISKFLDPPTKLEPVTIARGTGYWISGAPHNVSYPVAGVGVTTDRIRLAGNVLIWTADVFTFRLETALGRDGAVRVADSLR